MQMFKSTASLPFHGTVLYAAQHMVLLVTTENVSRALNHSMETND